MSTSLSLGGLDMDDRIDIADLERIVRHDFASETARYAITGSLLDYMIEEHTPILTYDAAKENIEYEVEFDWPDKFAEDKAATELSRTKDAFLRAGIATHPNLGDVMEQLRNHDDVIIGIDSNVLWDCTLTSHILEEIYSAPFPNWILIAIPRLVMAETENAANSKISSSKHARTGWPSYRGRLGHRALQEAMKIREQDPDRPGLAMMSVGEISEGANDINRSNWRLDSLIRNQFQEFLDDINFHKGTYFLSQDRVNVMMSGTEGSQGLYLQKPEFEAFSTGTVSVEQLTRLVFELSLQFGEVTLEDRTDDRSVTFEVFWPGKQVSDWREGRLNVSSLQA